jgi:Carboxypeptidase regulatory-like domain/TonB dependent receptor
MIHLRVLSLLSVILLATPAWAQVNTSEILGHVLDSASGAVANAVLTATQQETGFQRTARSDAEGKYHFLFLPPGPYTLTAQLTGFKLTKREGIIANAGAQLHVDLVLAPGDVTDQVTVEADAPLINTESSGMRSVISSAQVNRLPLPTRNLSSSVALSAGMAKSTAVDSFVVNGTSQYGINIALDGTDSAFFETPTLSPSVGEALAGLEINSVSLDSIREIELTKGVFSAETGRATGGSINVISKSGTNSLHGTLFEYLRNDKTDARNFFAATKDPLRQNQFGGSLGGPVIKDRLLIFGSYEGTRARVGQQITSNVPTQSLRNRLPGAYAPYLAALPLPTEAIAGNADAGIYRRSDTFRADPNLYNIRSDYNTGRSAFFARYTLNHGENSRPNLIPANRQIFPITNHVATVGHNQILSSSTVNDLRVGFNRWDIPRSNTTYPQNLGGITVTGILPTGNAEGILHFVGTGYSISDTLTRRVGRHSLRTGVDLRRIDSSRVQRNNPQFAYTSLAAFLADTPATVTVTYGNTGTTLRQYQSGLFLQDDWRLHPRLTLNLGLRYDYFSPLNSTDGRMRTTGNDPYGPFLPKGTPLWKPDKNNFQPRVGFAWDTTGKQKMVVRGGIGVYNVPVAPFFLWNSATIDPLLPASATYTPTDFPGLAYPLSGALLAAYQNPFAAVALGFAPAVVSRAVSDPNRRDPYTVTASLTLERQLAKDLALEITGIGSRTLKSPNGHTLNLVNPATKVRLVPTIGEITFSENSARRNYNALQVALRKRFAHGLSLNANHTWSQLIVYGGEDSFGSQPVQDPDNIAGSRGRSSADLRHLFLFDAAWDLPTFAFARQGIGKAVLGGWTLSSITQLRSGRPINLVTGRDNRGNALPGTQRPNYVGGPIYAAQKSILQWFNAAAFANPLTGAFGNIGRNAATGPNFARVDISLAKSWQIAEKHSVSFRAEAFNIQNRANFSNPDANMNSPTFGRITAADTSRQLQFSVRYRF